MSTITTATLTTTPSPPPSPTTIRTSSTIITTTITKCSVCTGTIKRKSTNILQKTKHSATPIFIFLEKIINEPLLICSASSVISEKHKIQEQTIGNTVVKIDKTGLCCRSCVIKINNYDKALLTAEQIQREIQQIYKRKFIEKTIKNEYNKCDKGFVTEQNDLQDTPSTNFVEKSKLINIKTEHIVVGEHFVHTDDDDDDDSSCYQDNLQESEECERKSGELEELLCAPALLIENSKLKTIEKHQHCQNSINNEKINKNNLVCHICGQIYKSKASLLVHSRLHTAMSNIHQCKFCGKKFAQKAALARHIPIHTGESLYQCDKCGKQYIHYSSFHMHQQAHDGIREKKCSICGLQLRSSSHLSRHMRVHSGEKPYACPTCGQRFAQRYNMTVHYKAHQGIHRLQTRSYVCLICQIRFQTQSKLTEHLSVQHNSAGNATNSLNGEQNCERISNDLIVDS